MQMDEKKNGSKLKKEMHHLLCCSGRPGEEVGVRGFAGVLYKWTNYGKGWRLRWFLLNRNNGVISYSSILPSAAAAAAGEDLLKFIGDDDDLRLDNNTTPSHKTTTLGRVLHLKVRSFRESRSDERKFYIFTSTKRLHLRTSSNKHRLDWIQALCSSTSSSSDRGGLLNHIQHPPPNISSSTQRLNNPRLQGFCDSQQIMLLEFQPHPSNLLLTLEASDIEAHTSGVPEAEYPLTQQEYSDLRCGKYSEWNTTESSNDVDKQQLDDASEDEETYFFDTQDFFPELKTQPQVMAETGRFEIERRKKLPEPAEKEKGVSLWSLIKDNIGKDLTRVCLPVYFNEPISSLQKCFEELEYSYLLDRAYHHGKQGNSLQRILNVAAFAVSGYAASDGRHCKPFNPLLGETYEADYPEKGVRFFSEKVSHHPTLIACHSEGKGWKFWGDSNIRTKFWGRSIQLDPVGVLTLEFDDGEVFQWSKVTTSIYNLILGKVYCDHHGTMHISGNREYSCKLKFKEQSILERNPRQVHGFVEDSSGKKHATLFGKWDENMYYINSVANVKPKDMSDANLLWHRTMPPINLTRYNLTSFAITLNELTPGLQEKLPPTDSRLRPDQRHLENGEYDMANSEKLRLETRQRMSRKLQENGWKPRWFQKDSEEGTYCYVGGYWEKREEHNWDGCPNIFGEFSDEISDSTSRG